MSLSIYRASVPVFLRALDSLSVILGKAAAHAEAKKIDPSVLLNSRLFPDMLPLIRQVQIATDSAKGAGGRLAGVELPKFEDNETSFPELTARLQKTVDFLKSLKQEQIDGSEDRTVTLKLPNGATDFKGQDYLFGFALPNFFFHVTTTYAILRHCGVELGKQDFLGKLS